MTWQPPPPPPPPLPPPPPPPPPPYPPSAARPPGRSRQGLLVGLIIGGLALLTVGGGVSAYLLARGGAHEEGRTGTLNVREASFGNGLSMLAEPRRDWQVAADEIVPGSTIQPLYYGEGSPPPDLLGFDDSFVGYAVRWDEDTDSAESAVFGLDAQDGSVAWRRGDLSPECAAVHHGQLLLCRRGTSGLALVDPRNGEDRARTDLAHEYATYLEHSGVVYVTYRPYDATGNDLSVAAYALPSLDRLWSTPLDVSVLDCCHGDYSMTVDGSALYVYWINARWRLDRADGRVTEATGTPTWRLTGGYTVTDHPDEYADEHGNYSVEDPQGRTILRHDGYPWYDPGGRVAASGRTAIGDTVFSLSTGAPLWSTPASFGSTPGASWTDDVRHVLVDDSDLKQTTVLDGDDGTRLLDLPGSYSYDDLGFTDEAVVSSPAGGQQVRVHDLDGGGLAWSEDISFVDTSFDPELANPRGIALSGRAIAVVGEGGVRGFTGFRRTAGGDGGRGSDDVAYTTACGRPPELVPVETELAGGGITITYEVHAVCPGGQWLNLSQLRVPVVVDGYTYADGYFDFSDRPRWIPDDDTDDAAGERRTLRLTYDFADTTVPYDDIADAVEADGGTSTVVVVPCEPGPDNRDDAPVPGDPAYGGDPAQAVGSSGSPVTDDDQVQESALEALRRIAAEDRDAVAQLDWTAQLSSKKPGTYDDGIVYDSYDAILALHLEYRSRYPESLLAWSNDWPGSFGPSSQDYWVTLGGQSEATTIPILDWCRAEGWGDGDCWAKRLLTTGDPDKESRHKDSWPPDPSKN